ncbi:MAG: hypothetical protein ACKVOU_03720 [Cytophagales bacterium]
MTDFGKHINTFIVTFLTGLLLWIANTVYTTSKEVAQIQIELKNMREITEIKLENLQSQVYKKN